MPDRPRVIVALPNATERAQVAEWLSVEDLEPVLPATAQDAVNRMRARPYDLLIADAGFAFRDWLDAKGSPRNPLTPTIVIGSEADEPKGNAVDGKAMYLARPVERAMLVCFVTMALLEARPTRRSMRKPVERLDAFANGVPSHLVDVSNEGLRIEVPSDLRAGLPAYFSVRVPLIGVAMSVQRMWTQLSPSRSATAWYGGALAGNRPGTEQAWRSFIDMIPAIGQAGTSPSS